MQRWCQWPTHAPPAAPLPRTTQSGWRSGARPSCSWPRTRGRSRAAPRSARSWQTRPAGAGQRGGSGGGARRESARAWRAAVPGPPAQRLPPGEAGRQAGGDCTRTTPRDGPHPPAHAHLPRVHHALHLHAPPDGVQRVADRGRQRARRAAQQQVGARVLPPAGAGRWAAGGRQRRRACASQQPQRPRASTLQTQHLRAMSGRQPAGAALRSAPVARIVHVAFQQVVGRKVEGGVGRDAHLRGGSRGVESEGCGQGAESRAAQGAVPTWQEGARRARLWPGAQRRLQHGSTPCPPPPRPAQRCPRPRGAAAPAVSQELTSVGTSPL